MCLFCSMTRRQAFRALTAAAVGGAAGASSGGAVEPVILGEGAYRYRVVEGWGALPPGFTYRDGAVVCAPAVNVATVSGPSSPTMASGDLPRAT